jgi:hypothetical protein
MQFWGGTCDFDDAAAGEQHIGALEVAVHDVVGVNEVTGAKGEQSRVEQKKDTRHERDGGGGGGGGAELQATHELSENVDNEVLW